jgi:NhaP-type Na+/H+ and K+/H+ antiporter
VAMLGGVRGAVSIVLATSITATVMLSDSDVTLISTMVFGVAFISIMIQVPMLMRYVQSNLAQVDEENSNELNMNFETLQEQITEVNRQKLEGKISPEDYDLTIAEIKCELNEIICNSSASLTTKKIIQRRANTIFATLPKFSPLHTMVDSNRRWWHHKKKKKTQ